MTATPTPRLFGRTATTGTVHAAYRTTGSPAMYPLCGAIHPRAGRTLEPVAPGTDATCAKCAAYVARLAATAAKIEELRNSPEVDRAVASVKLERGETLTAEEVTGLESLGFEIPAAQHPAWASLRGAGVVTLEATR